MRVRGDRHAALIRRRIDTERLDRNLRITDTADHMLKSLYEERLRNHEAIMGAFDFLNDNGPFESHDIGLKQVRNVMLYAIQNSTFKPE